MDAWCLRRVGWLVFATACSFAPHALDTHDGGGGSDASTDGPHDSGGGGTDASDAAPADDPVALYEFDDGIGTTVHDTGRAPPIDLTIDDITRVVWTTGALVITNDVRIESSSAATKIIDAAKASNAITIEAWLTPASDGQVGPSRVAGVSFDANNRNVSLMQDATKWAFRLRTSGTTGANGQPDVDSGSTIMVVPQRQYVVATEEGTDRVIYVDGVEAGRDHSGGSLASWDESYTAIIANDHVGTDRPWHGTLYRVAFYDRVFSAAEVVARNQAGPP